MTERGLIIIVEENEYDQRRAMLSVESRTMGSASHLIKENPREAKIEIEGFSTPKKTLGVICSLNFSNAGTEEIIDLANACAVRKIPLIVCVSTERDEGVDLQVSALKRNGVACRVTRTGAKDWEGAIGDILNNRP
jgi:hypothetical protein